MDWLTNIDFSNF